MNEQALLNVAKACRESKNPNEFTMACHINRCGTPACAFGHYAAREDLQSDFIILNPEEIESLAAENDGELDASDGVLLRSTRKSVGFDSPEVAEHFGLLDEEMSELFSGFGCGEAETPIEAAEYIERFVARNQVLENA
jgi:hypothetical protein